MFYVYEWYVKDTNEIIYVGKGTGNRYKVRKHNKLFNEMIRRFECLSRIVKEFDTEEEAFEFEYIHVNELKLAGQCVCNIRNGGFGGSTSWWTDELRKRYSEKNAMKSSRQRQRMRENNPMSDPKISAMVNGRKRKAVIIGEQEYASVSDACQKLGVCGEVIQRWCQKGINGNGELCRYKGMEQVHFSGKRYNKGGCKSLTYQGKNYESAIDLANELNVNHGTVLKWLKKGFDSNGNPCVYDEDKAEHEYKPNKFAPKAVIVNGVTYATITKAAKANNVCVDTIRSALNGKHKTRNLICEYAN